MKDESKIRITYLSMKSRTKKSEGSYKNTFLSPKWETFEKFKKWYENNYPKNVKELLVLDKDLLQSEKLIKVYGPTTCVFLPERINNFLIKSTAKNNTGIYGVSYIASRKKYQATIRNFETGKNLNLGQFETPEEAEKAYKKARKEMSEKAKTYLRALDYLPEEIIELIK